MMKFKTKFESGDEVFVKYHDGNQSVVKQWCQVIQQLTYESPYWIVVMAPDGTEESVRGSEVSY